MRGRNRDRFVRAARRAAGRPAGMTLVELLVVVVIVTLLLAAAIPLMKPALKENQIREASRQVNAFFAGAKARATEIGRPVGVWIERSPPPDNNASVQLYLAETPPIYSGDAANATAEVTFIPANPSGSPPTPARWIIADDTNTARPEGFINCETLTTSSAFALTKVGETVRIKFNYQGAYYPCTRISLTPPIFELQVAGQVTPPTGIALPFQILLSPRRSSAAPLQLPAGIVIDLVYSGIGGVVGSSGQGVEFFDATNTDESPVVVVFRPAGDVERLSYSNTPQAATGTIHLLIGRLDQVNEPAETNNPIRFSATDATMLSYTVDITDTSNVWISIGHRSGLITSSPNGWQLSGTPPNFYDSFRRARAFAQAAQSVGGR